MKISWKIILAILFTAAVALGLIQHNQEPYLNKQSFYNAESTSGGGLNYYYEKSKNLAGITDNTSTVTFLAVGDMMLSRNVAGTIQKNNDPLLPFRTMESILKSTNFNFGNLESPFTEKNPIIGGHSLVFGAPKEYVKGLVDYNFKILNLANNHGFDQGLKGLQFTNSWLDQNGIKHIGAGASLKEAWQPAIITANGLNICFIGASYSSINDGGKATNNFIARIEDVKNLKSSILNLKSKCDFIVATMHAGTEYVRNPNKSQIGFAHTAIEAGADMVIGAHPHWIQTMEQYQGKYIFYSLGNFIFDQEWSQDTKEGLTLKIQISKNKTSNPAAPGAAQLDDLQGNRVPAQLDSIELIPVIIENYSTPRPATEEESRRILEKIKVQNDSLR